MQCTLFLESERQTVAPVVWKTGDVTAQTRALVGRCRGQPASLVSGEQWRTHRSTGTCRNIHISLTFCYLTNLSIFS